ncbi:MAG: hypothetical protein U1F87_12160 [Kiritimatiellia bacterium]
MDEACNYTNKFPSARLYLHHARGYALAESFLHQSPTPTRPLVVGDPICQPYAVPPNVTLGGATNTQAVAGTLAPNLSACKPGRRVRIGRIEFFIDGKDGNPLPEGPHPWQPRHRRRERNQPARHRTATP